MATAAPTYRAMFETPDASPTCSAGTHEVEAADAAWHGRHVALSTGTASGKTLGYLMPVLAATLTGLTPAGPVRPEPTGTAGWRATGRPHTALYLAPTKALAHDQLRACADLGLSGWPIAARRSRRSANRRCRIRVAAWDRGLQIACYSCREPTGRCGERRRPGGHQVVGKKVRDNRDPLRAL